MKPWCIPSRLLVLVPLLAAGTALAQPAGGGRPFGPHGPGPGYMVPMERPVADRPPPYAGPHFPPGHGPRMSPEQRRQLRQDIRNAGEDIYRRPPPPWQR